MDMCIQEGLHQVDLLSPAETKITQAEYMAQKSGQKKLEETNKQIIALITFLFLNFIYKNHLLHYICKGDFYE